MDELNQKITNLERQVLALEKANDGLESRILQLERNWRDFRSMQNDFSRQFGILNCWEFMRCGREPKGQKVSEMGICPSAEMKKYDGINRGKNSGRICWALVGTLCGGRIQGVFAEKISSCLKCEFYQYVCLQEGKEMQYALLSRD